ncbi:MAG: ribonuclease P protein component [Myxococcota bacterium]
MAATLRREERLRDARDFRRANRSGKRRVSRHFVAVVAASREPGAAKLGLAVSRRVGNAVARNRVKRRIREWFRQERGRLPQDTDWVLIARAGAAELPAPVARRELDELAAR